MSKPGKAAPSTRPHRAARGLDPFEHLPLAAYVDEIDGDGRVRMRSASRLYETLTGHRAEQFADDAHLWDQGVHSDDLPAYLAARAELERGDAPMDVTYRHRHGTGGRWVWLRDQAVAQPDPARGVTVVSGIVADVTREREAEEAAARTRATLEHRVAERTRELRRALAELQQTNTLQRVVASLSTHLLSLPADAVDGALEQALGAVGQAVRADRGAVLLLDPDSRRVEPAAEWCAAGTAPARGSLRHLPLDYFPVWTKQLAREGTGARRTASEARHGFDPTQQLLSAAALASCVVTPMRTMGYTSGYLLFGNAYEQRDWPESTAVLLETAADAIASALERRRIETALAASEANHRDLFESLDDVVVVADPAGRIVHVNSAAVRVLGRDVDDLRGRHVLDLHPPQVRGEAEEIVGDILAGRRDSCPLPLESSDGRLVQVETRVTRATWDGSPCIVGVSRDLTAELEALQRFDRLFHGNPALMAVNAVDGDRPFLDVNDAFLETLGFTRDEVIGRSGTDLGLFPRPEDQLTVAGQLAASGRVRDVELKVRTKDGRLLDGVFSGDVIESQGTALFLTVMVDNTARKQAEEEILRLNATLEDRVARRTAQLEAADRELRGFVSSVAHDLRTPLRAIGSYAQIVLLDHGDTLPDEGRDAVLRIIGANGRLERSIAALLDLSGLTHHTLRVERVDLTALALEVVDDLRRMAPGRDTEVRVAEGLAADADPSLALILTENLLGNAWKFTSRTHSAVIEVGRTDAEDEAVFFVRDDGAGFDPQYAHRLFEPFERLHDRAEFGGTGVGLATVRRIVERHGGRVWAQGEPGHGATFFFTLAPPPGG